MGIGAFGPIAPSLDGLSRLPWISRVPGKPGEVDAGRMGLLLSEPAVFRTDIVGKLLEGRKHFRGNVTAEAYTSP
jgi:hypothetical protein